MSSESSSQSANSQGILPARRYEGITSEPQNLLNLLSDPQFEEHKSIQLEEANSFNHLDYPSNSNANSEKDLQDYNKFDPDYRYQIQDPILAENFGHQPFLQINDQDIDAYLVCSKAQLSVTNRGFIDNIFLDSEKKSVEKFQQLASRVGNNIFGLYENNSLIFLTSLSLLKDYSDNRNRLLQSKALFEAVIKNIAQWIEMLFINDDPRKRYESKHYKTQKQIYGDYRRDIRVRRNIVRKTLFLGFVASKFFIIQTKQDDEHDPKAKELNLNDPVIIGDHVVVYGFDSSRTYSNLSGSGNSEHSVGEKMIEKKQARNYQSWIKNFKQQNYISPNQQEDVQQAEPDFDWDDSHYEQNPEALKAFDGGEAENRKDLIKTASKYLKPLLNSLFYSIYMVKLQRIWPEGLDKLFLEEYISAAIGMITSGLSSEEVTQRINDLFEIMIGSLPESANLIVDYFFIFLYRNKRAGQALYQYLTKTPTDINKFLLYKLIKLIMRWISQDKDNQNKKENIGDGIQKRQKDGIIKFKGKKKGKDKGKEKKDLKKEKEQQEIEEQMEEFESSRKKSQLSRKVPKKKDIMDMQDANEVYLVEEQIVLEKDVQPLLEKKSQINLQIEADQPILNQEQGDQIEQFTQLSGIQINNINQFLSLFTTMISQILAHKPQMFYPLVKTPHQQFRRRAVHLASCAYTAPHLDSKQARQIQNILLSLFDDSNCYIRLAIFKTMLNLMTNKPLPGKFLLKIAHRMVGCLQDETKIVRSAAFKKIHQCFTHLFNHFKINNLPNFLGKAEQQIRTCIQKKQILSNDAKAMYQKIQRTKKRGIDDKESNDLFILLVKDIKKINTIYSFFIKARQVEQIAQRSMDIVSKAIIDFSTTELTACTNIMTYFNSKNVPGTKQVLNTFYKRLIILDFAKLHLQAQKEKKKKTEQQFLDVVDEVLERKKKNKKNIHQIVSKMFFDTEIKTMQKFAENMIERYRRQNDTTILMVIDQILRVLVMENALENELAFQVNKIWRRFFFLASERDDKLSDESKIEIKRLTRLLDVLFDTEVDLIESSYISSINNLLLDSKKSNTNIHALIFFTKIIKTGFLSLTSKMKRITIYALKVFYQFICEQPVDVFCELTRAYVKMSSIVFYYGQHDIKDEIWIRGKIQKKRLQKYRLSKKVYNNRYGYKSKNKRYVPFQKEEYNNSCDHMLALAQRKNMIRRGIREQRIKLQQQMKKQEQMKMENNEENKEENKKKPLQMAKIRVDKKIDLDKIRDKLNMKEFKLQQNLFDNFLSEMEQDRKKKKKKSEPIQIIYRPVLNLSSHPKSFHRILKQNMKIRQKRASQKILYKENRYLDCQPLDMFELKDDIFSFHHLLSQVKNVHANSIGNIRKVIVGEQAIVGEFDMRSIYIQNQNLAFEAKYDFIMSCMIEQQGLRIGAVEGQILMMNNTFNHVDLISKLEIEKIIKDGLDSDMEQKEHEILNFMPILDIFEHKQSDYELNKLSEEEEGKIEMTKDQKEIIKQQIAKRKLEKQNYYQNYYKNKIGKKNLLYSLNKFSQHDESYDNDEKVEQQYHQEIINQQDDLIMGYQDPDHLRQKFLKQRDLLFNKKEKEKENTKIFFSQVKKKFDKICTRFFWLKPKKNEVEKKQNKQVQKRDNARKIIDPKIENKLNNEYDSSQQSNFKKKKVEFDNPIDINNPKKTNIDKPPQIIRRKKINRKALKDEKKIIQFQKRYNLKNYQPKPTAGPKRIKRKLLSKLQRDMDDVYLNLRRIYYEKARQFALQHKRTDKLFDFFDVCNEQDIDDLRNVRNQECINECQKLLKMIAKFEQGYETEPEWCEPEEDEESNQKKGKGKKKLKRRRQVRKKKNKKNNQDEKQYISTNLRSKMDSRTRQYLIDLRNLFIHTISKVTKNSQYNRNLLRKPYQKLQGIHKYDLKMYKQYNLNEIQNFNEALIEKMRKKTKKYSNQLWSSRLYQQFSLKTFYKIQQMIKTMKFTINNQVSFLSMFKIVYWNKSQNPQFYNNSLVQLLTLIKQLNNYNTPTDQNIERYLQQRFSFKMIAIQGLMDLIFDSRNRLAQKLLLLSNIIGFLFDIDQEVSQTAMYAIQSIYSTNQQIVLTKLIEVFPLFEKQKYPTQFDFIDSLFRIKNKQTPILCQIMGSASFFSRVGRKSYGFEIRHDSYKRLMEILMKNIVPNQPEECRFECAKVFSELVFSQDTDAVVRRACMALAQLDLDRDCFDYILFHRHELIPVVAKKQFTQYFQIVLDNWCKKWKKPSTELFLGEFFQKIFVELKSPELAAKELRRSDNLGFAEDNLENLEAFGKKKGKSKQTINTMAGLIDAKNKTIQPKSNQNAEKQKNQKLIQPPNELTLAVSSDTGQKQDKSIDRSHFALTKAQKEYFNQYNISYVPPNLRPPDKNPAQRPRLAQNPNKPFVSQAAHKLSPAYMQALDKESEQLSQQLGQLTKRFMNQNDKDRYITQREIREKHKQIQQNEKKKKQREKMIEKRMMSSDDNQDKEEIMARKQKPNPNRK